MDLSVRMDGYLDLVAGKIADFRSGSSPLPARLLGSVARPASHTFFFSPITSRACSDRDGTATGYCEEAARQASRIFCHFNC